MILLPGCKEHDDLKKLKKIKDLGGANKGCFAPFGSLERSIDNYALKQTQHFFKKMILDILSV